MDEEKLANIVQSAAAPKRFYTTDEEKGVHVVQSGTVPPPAVEPVTGLTAAPVAPVLCRELGAVATYPLTSPRRSRPAG